MSVVAGVRYDGLMIFSYIGRLGIFNYGEGSGTNGVGVGDGLFFGRSL